MADNIMTDSELDRLLAAARQPELPTGFAQRLQAKLQVEAPNNVVAFPVRNSSAPQPARRLWLSAIPLAASLAVGIYVGAMGNLSDVFSGLDSIFVATADDSNLELGIEDTELFLNGEIS